MPADLQTLDCILDCILSKGNGGSPGGNATFDNAVTNVRSGQGSPTDFDLVVAIPLSYFYAQSNTAFDAFKTSLWRCIAGCINMDPNTIPSWFDASRTIGLLLS